ncbi:MAG: transposase [Calditrichaeota bacterium]|nr:transposase [Calditrichota bacterium]
MASRSIICPLVTKGYNPSRAKRRTGIKAHLVMDLTNRLPERIAIGSGKQADATTLNLLNALGKETVRVFDRGYRQYKTFIKYIEANEWFVTPRVMDSMPNAIVDFEITQNDLDHDVIADQLCYLGSQRNTRGYSKYQIRCVMLLHRNDPDCKPQVLMTNMMNISATEVVEIYNQRCLIEVDIHHLKQLLGISKLGAYSEHGILNQWIIALICYLLIWLFERTHYQGFGFWKAAKFIRYNITETWYSLELPAPT